MELWLPNEGLETNPMMVQLDAPSEDEASRRSAVGRPDDLRDAVRVALRRYYEVCRRGLAALGLTRLELASLARIVAASSRSALAVGVINADPAYGDADVAAAWDELSRVAAGLAWSDPDEARDVVGLVGRLRARPYADLVCLVDLAERLVAHDAATLRSVLGDRLDDYLYADPGGVRPPQTSS